jgi:23S rRNA pseudouridine2604 synthase
MTGQTRQRRFPLLVMHLSIVCFALSLQTNSGAHRLHRRSDTTTTVLSLSSENSPHKVNGVRLNKVLKATFSRREADKVIQEGRVSVNGEVSFGCMVVPYQDSVALDGKMIQGWEKMNGFDDTSTSAVGGFEYVKYWKPRGVICTTDKRIKDNIIDEIMRHSGYRPEHRVYPVGRLDKDSTGLILLTSDGRLPNVSLRNEQKQPKVYQVTVDRPLVDADLDHLRNGIVITTVAQRDGTAKPLTAKTKPCLVDQVSLTSCSITLTEGRNRQIRKMMEAVGYKVLDLHRTEFGEISLNSLMQEGDWQRLNGAEMRWIETILQDEINDQ